MFTREGVETVGTLEVLAVRCGGCGDLIGRAGGGLGDAPLAFREAFCLARCIAATSIDCDRGPPPSILIAGSFRIASALLVDPQCCASIERLSSMGVKMLCALAWAGRGLGCGNGGLVN